MNDPTVVLRLAAIGCRADVTDALEAQRGAVMSWRVDALPDSAAAIRSWAGSTAPTADAVLMAAASTEAIEDLRALRRAAPDVPILALLPANAPVDPAALQLAGADAVLSEAALDAARLETAIVRTLLRRPHVEPTDAGQQRPDGSLRPKPDPFAAGFEALIERLPDGVGVHRNGRFLYANRALAVELGYDRAADLVGVAVLDVVHPSERTLVSQHLEGVALGLQAAPRQERLLRRDGSVMLAEVIGLSVDFAGEPAILTLIRDIGQQKQLVGKMMQMDRMIAVGSLASGVGHEINNPLTYIVANLDYVLDVVESLRGDSRPPAASGGPNQVMQTIEEVRHGLEEAREGAQRIRKIVRDLRTFSRPDDTMRGMVELETMLDSVLGLASNEIRHRARVERDFASVPSVEGNPAQLGQVALNLVLNAAQAIPEGSAESNRIRVRTFVDNGKVVLEVTDSGVGIAPEHIPRLFDPFFTTKPVGQGTGLGLAICSHIVEAHGGIIEVDSEVGRGSTFRVILPPTAGEGGRTLSNAETAVAGRRGRVLVIDDDPLVARVVRRTLEREHDVTALTEARVALAQLQRGDAFDLIFCDLMMPEMTGMDLFEELSTLRPDQARRVVFLTGGAFTPRAREFLDRVPNAEVEKPFDARKLRQIVRDLLETETR